MIVKTSLDAPSSDMMKKDKTNGVPSGFDLVGDLHGHAALLRRLLGRLGYHEAAGCFRHPHRKVVFLGDFIDRGPAIRETLRIVRSMIDGGAALAVMGNHEFNALCYHTLGEDGAPLRAHTDKNRDQLQATLDAFKDFPEKWQDHLTWFRTLPLYLEMPGFRVVHAAWDEARIADLHGRDRLNEATLRNADRRSTPEYGAVEMLLNGLEIELPNGYRFSDNQGFSRSKIRTKWWLSGAGRTYRDLVFPHCDDIPAIPVPAKQLSALTGYADQAPPVFVGHYWLPPGHPKVPLTENVACLDFSVAKGGPLVAYRWNGAGPLNADGFVSSE
jgi:hypothetical protein